MNAEKSIVDTYSVWKLLMSNSNNKKWDDDDVDDDDDDDDDVDDDDDLLPLLLWTPLFFMNKICLNQHLCLQVKKPFQPLKCWISENVLVTVAYNPYGRACGK